MAAADDGAGSCVIVVLEADTVVLLAEIGKTLPTVLDEVETVVEEREERLLFVAYGILKPEEGASVEGTSTALERPAVVLF